MGKRLHILILLWLLGLQGCIVVNQKPSTQKVSTKFRQMNFQELINRYMKKGEANSIEGVYTVSGIVLKNGRNILGIQKSKTTDRKENYATVAIIREKEGGKDLIELSLNKKELTSYSIIGEFQAATSGNILVYKHYDAKGKDTSYTFTWDEAGEILEGVRVENWGNSEITYKLTYVKMKPK